MQKRQTTSATEAGTKNSLGPASAPAVNCGAHADLETQLERILPRVPPLITLPRAKQRCPFTGESRTGLLELVSPCERNNWKPPVQAIYKRSHKHATRGRWLIPAENLFRHLLGMAEGSAETYVKLARERKEARKS